MSTTTRELVVPNMDQVLALHQAFLAAQKTITIEISQEDLAALKKAKYKLCFAKRVGDNDYNVVWQSYDDYLATNEFSWVPQYQLFGTNRFASSVVVKASTNIVTIGLQETSVLDEAGNLGNPKTGGEPTAFTLQNEYGSIHPGVMQLSIGIHGEMKSSPIYVAADPVVLGKTELTPVESVLVWFEQNVSTSTMFSTSRSNAVEIDLTTANEAARLYAAQKWITP